MSYQVLARKWRPKSFEDLVGQGHVVRALTNALARGQLHHAYLFAGTRGVGKTTLARILAKALNCEQGVGPSPCGVCASCHELDEGRFVDLLEVDAASRTKVEQTRELLDNVPFAPVKGRYKVYLIDEVHMFSEKSFNALLKTLEEPPDHVKFLLATTDPQKLPVTVLSRCLQLNLKRLLPDAIQGQLARVLDAEGVAYEPAALALLARSADGSMRDGLSLLDQAIAYGGGRVNESETRAMLGVAGRDLGMGLAQALSTGDGRRLLTEVGRIAELASDFADVLRELLLIFHRVALAQQVPQALGADDPEREALMALAAALTPEDVQLFYQILLTGQQDLSLAPDPRTGMEMVLLRALAFRPIEMEGARNDAVQPAHANAPTPKLGTPQGNDRQASLAISSPPPSPAIADGPPERYGPTPLSGAEDWHQLIARLGLGGMANELAHHCELSDWDGQCLRLNLDAASQHVRVPSAEERLRKALEETLGEGLRIEITLSHPTGETPAQRRQREADERQAEAERVMHNDPVAGAMRAQFDADWLPGSIGPGP